jgi:hypothetical protein
MGDYQTLGFKESLVYTAKYLFWLELLRGPPLGRPFF